jgi:hypothetical protein
MKVESSQDLEFNLLQHDQAGNVVSVTYRWRLGLVDNSYFKLVHHHCSLQEYQQSQRIQVVRVAWSMQTDVECTFGILKGQWQILKSGIRVSGHRATDKFGKPVVLCITGYWRVDGLHEKREEGEPSPWEGEELGQFEMADLHAIPRSIRQRLSAAEFQAYDSSRFGCATSCSASEENDAGNVDTEELFLPPVATFEQPLPEPVVGGTVQICGISHTLNFVLVLCPCCQTACETQFHLIHCRSNPARQESLTEFHKEVRRSQGKNFGRIISDVFEQWFEDPYVDPSLTNTRDPTLDYEGFSPDFVQYVKTAISHQNEIGWMNATQGFLAKSWYQVACTQIQIPGPNGIIHSSRDDGHSRTYKVVCALHTLVTSLWKGRNDVLHRQDHEKGVLLRTVVDADIARLHSTPSSLPVADQHYCHHSLAYILGKSPAYKRRWLYRVRAAAERYKQDQCQQHRITDFYYREPHQRQKQSTLTEYDNPVSPTTAPKHHRRLIRTTQRTLTEFFANAPLI